MFKKVFLFFVLFVFYFQPLFPFEKSFGDSLSTVVGKEIAKVSWYGSKFHGRKTANGEVYNMNAFTAAHKSLKFGTLVKITNPENGKSVEVRINDRGPYVSDRLFDLSKAAFSEIANTDRGVAFIEYEIVSENQPLQIKEEVEEVMKQEEAEPQIIEETAN